MKINYPIKYAAMPIIEQVGWSNGLHELERKYDVVCYIVSKCYLINDSTKYTEDGRSIKEYEVVFPYQQHESSKWRRVTPTYNIMNRHCTNSDKIDAVFDSYEEALNHANNKNENIYKDICSFLPYTEDIIEKIQKHKDEFDAKLAEYKVLEYHILLHTDDIEIGNNKQLNSAIKIANDNARILRCSIYDVLYLYEKDKFVVYTISQKQYDDLIKLINEDNINNIKSVIGNVQGLLIHKTEDDLIKLAIEEACGVYYIENNSINYDYKLDKVTKENFENIDEDALVFYTTETIKDLLNSYKKHLEIDLRIVQGPVLKKVKK